jgi:hypothetical protein
LAAFLDKVLEKCPCLSVGGVISQLIAGGAGGAILTAIIGAIKNKALA